MPSLRAVLEAALVENPDDLATHRAYADYLQEQGDPRGEFIQVQLALEEPTRTPAERRVLERRERELLNEYGREWLGILADELLRMREESEEESNRCYEIHFARGWLDRIACSAADTRPSNLGKMLIEAPEVRLLRELILSYNEGVIEELARSPFLRNVRVIQIGQQDDYPGDFIRRLLWCTELPVWIGKLPRIEELYLYGGGYNPLRLFSLPNLEHLRILHVHHLMIRYPLEILAMNSELNNLEQIVFQPYQSPQSLIDLAGVRALVQSPHLRSLTHLRLRGSDLGNVGCTEIVTSGILKRLKVLDLRHGEITDAGARTLADCPDLRRLELLDIERNGLTQTGIDALRRVLGSRLRADDQQTAEELERRQYLREGYME